MTVLDDVYAERNRCVALIARLALNNGWHAGIKQHVGAEWEDDWRNVIFVDIPTGQLSWHIHDSQLYLFAFLPLYDADWDHHTTDEKYTRIADYTLYGSNKQ